MTDSTNIHSSATKTVRSGVGAARLSEDVGERRGNDGDTRRWLVDRSAIVSQIENLPAMPQVIVRAVEIVRDSLSGIKELSGVLEMDPGMVARILKMANSAYYGLRGKVHSLNHACVLLGKTTLREVIMTAGLAGLMESELPGYRYAAMDLWRHSISVAMCAKNISHIRFPELIQEAYVAGIIHDTGKIVLDPFVLKAKDAFDAYLASDPNSTFLDAETAILGLGHAEIALDVCRKWHIPEAISEAVGFHHHPSLSGGKPVAYAVHMADHIARSCGFGYGIDDLLYEPEEGAVLYLGLDEARLNELKTRLIEDMLTLDEP